MPVGHDDRDPKQIAGEIDSSRKAPAGANTRIGLRSSKTNWRKLLEAEGAQVGPVEQPCPNCGKPMLASWGATCGQCRPGLASPKTLMLAVDDLAKMLSMTLGWLVVARTPDQTQQGALIELVAPVVVLTRENAAPAPGMHGVAFRDDYLSVDNSTLRRPQGTSKDDAFTIEDRSTPGPSKNGTLVNGRRLLPGEVCRLSDGDNIHVGATTLVFKSLWLPHGAGS